MNILFLDVDGVLNSKQHFLMAKEKNVPGKDTMKEADFEYMKNYTNPNNMWCLKYILDNVPDLKIVLSTSWRNHFETNLFKDLFQFYGLDGERIIGKTPKKFSSERIHEIHMYLDDHTTPPLFEGGEFDGKWVALDDHVIFGLEDPDKQNEILTDPWIGLTMLDAFKIIKKFNPKFKEPIIAI